MAKRFKILLEELDEYQKQYVDEHLGGKSYDSSKAHVKMFDSYPDRNHRDRIVFEHESSTFSKIKEIPSEVLIHLHKNGYGYDADRNMASKTFTDKFGKDKIQYLSVGKVLQKTEADKVLTNKYNKKDERHTIMSLYTSSKSTGNPINIVISRDKHDIAGMSTDRHWQSCMTLPTKNSMGGSNHHYIEKDLQNHSMIAYVTNKGDDDIEKPLGRVLIKKYTTDDGKHMVYRAKVTHGNINNEHVDAINKILRKHYPSKQGLVYNLNGSSYQEGYINLTEYKGLVNRKENGFDITEHYDDDSRYHDYVDSDGKQQPAIVTRDGHFHFKHGLLHKDGDEPAYVTRSLIEYHKNGLNHRDGDKPAVIDSANKILTYKKFGVIHRDSDNPSVIKYSDGYMTHPSTEEYYQFGTLHRDGDKPARIYYNDKGIAIQKEFIQNNVFHRDGDKPARKYYNDDGKLIGEDYFINGKEHREGKLPSSTYDDGLRYHKIYSKHGRLHSPDENTPSQHIREKDANGNLIHELIEYHNMGRLHRNNGYSRIRYDLDDGNSTIQYSKSPRYNEIDEEPDNLKITTTKNGDVFESKLWSNHNHNVMSIDTGNYADGTKSKLINYYDHPEKINYESYNRDGTKTVGYNSRSMISKKEYDKEGNLTSFTDKGNNIYKYEHGNPVIENDNYEVDKISMDKDNNVTFHYNGKPYKYNNAIDEFQNEHGDVLDQVPYAVSFHEDNLPTNKEMDDSHKELLKYTRKALKRTYRYN